MLATWPDARQALVNLLLLEEDYCGDGTGPPEPALVRSALDLTEALQAGDNPVPFHVYPSPDGDVCLLWRFAGVFPEEIDMDVDVPGHAQIMVIRSPSPLVFSDLYWWSSRQEQPMCVGSLVVDHYLDKWGHRRDQIIRDYGPSYAPVLPRAFDPALPPMAPTLPAISPAEVAEFRQLLERAREYDKRTGQPDCEMADKKARLKQLARDLGVEIAFP